MFNDFPCQVRKLWCDYGEAKSAVASPFSSSTTSAESREGDDFEADATASTVSSSSALPGSSAIDLAAGQGPARALRAFVDAVDLTDARQAAVLQNLVSVLAAAKPNLSAVLKVLTGGLAWRKGGEGGCTGTLVCLNCQCTAVHDTMFSIYLGFSRSCKHRCVYVYHFQDEVGQGELVTTLIQLAEALVVADAGGSLSLSPTAGDVALAEKCLTVAQTCLVGAT